MVDAPIEEDAFAYDLEELATEIEAAVADDSTGGGLLLCHLMEAAGEVRSGDLDAAELSLQCVEMLVQQFRDKLEKLLRGEI